MTDAIGKLHQQADKRNKANAKNPLTRTGGDRRMTEEMVNTASLARAQGLQRVIPREIGVIPLAQLVRRPGK